MNSKVQRKQTLYTKDVIPAKFIRNINNEVDFGAMVKEQLLKVKSLESQIENNRTSLITAIDRVSESESYWELANLGSAFLQQLLADVQNDEKILRNKILGKQEAVEMFKSAVSNQEVPGTYLEAARTDRDETSVGLFEIVSMRETVFSALEILRRTTLPPYDKQPDERLQKMKEQYEFLQLTLKEEHNRLKQFTEWQKNPALMYRELDK
uniref:Uncharacterized protein LOC100181115 n=1 Tax=Phallusia mammillata TaxID=59560 RepID=A0A6F9DIA5_9ASCI|nr:uncharacterized protein LOC100181115 [Phallusia mammillata]